MGVSQDVFYEDDGCEEKNTDYDHCEDGYNSMKYDVYYPDSIDNKRVSYNNCGLPAIIMFHGGSFKECSDKQNHGIKYLCIEMAKRGFVVFNVEYRRGVLLDFSRPYENSKYRHISAQQILALYRACQDVRGAVRTIIYKQRNSYFNADFQIDTQKLFIGGISAGSLAAMNAAYYERQGQIDSAWPGASAVLGDIDQDYYIGDTNVNFIPLIRGVLDMWGAIAVHPSKKSNPGSMLNGNVGNPSIIAFQGLDDNIFPVDTANLFFSPEGIYNEETHCLTTGSSYTVDDDDETYDVFAIGAEGIYKAFRNKGIVAEIYIDCNMEHGMDDDCSLSDPSCVFDSEFGTHALNQDAVYSYIAARTTTYFVTIIAELEDDLGRSRFVECENFRVKCDIGDTSSCSYDPGADERNFRCSDISE